MNIKAYFNSATDLRAYCLNQSIFLRPFDETYLEQDLAALNMLAFDLEVKKYMSGFYGIEPDAVERRKEYLVNTIITTQIGIAFAYAIRLNAGLCGWIKVTSPSHNIVTNNFSNWLIDFVTLPMFRKKNLMKASIPIILDLMRDDMDVEEVYAMVDSANKSVTLCATSTSDAHKETIDNFQFTDAVETDYHVLALDMQNLKVLCAGNNKGVLSKELCDLGKELRGLGINVQPSTPAIKAYNDYGFITDDVNEFVVIATSNRIFVHRYSDIVSIAYEENGTDVFNKSIGGAVAGGILFGGVGAIVGGSTAKAKQNKEVSKMSIKILLKSTTNPTIILPIYEAGKDGSLIETKNAADKMHYEGLLKEVSGIKDVFSIIIDIVDRNIKVHQVTARVQNTSNSVADELSKLADLKAKGILTEDEFNLQKSKLLNI